MRRPTLLLVLAAVAALTLGGCASTAAGTWTYPPVMSHAAMAHSAAPSADASAPPEAAASPVAAAGPVAAGEVLGTLEVKAVDLGFDPKELSVDKAGTYAVTLTNTGSIPHDITFADGATGIAKPGETVTVDVAIPDSGITFLCSIPGHADAGMKGAITVAGSTAASGGADDHGGPMPATDIQPDPNAPPYTLYPAEAPALLPGTVHDVDLVIHEKDVTVQYDPTAKTGFVVHAWTFGDAVPGPVIRVKVGDTIRVHLK